MIKTKYYIWLTIALIFTFQCEVFGQTFLSKEQEKNIKVSRKYFFGEGSDFNIDIAHQNALEDLTNQIISAKILQSTKAEEVIKEMEIRAHINRLEQKGKIKIIAWIAKDSVLVNNNSPVNYEQANAKEAEQLMQKINDYLNEGNCDRAQKVYNSWKEFSKTTNTAIEHRIVECKSGNGATKSITEKTETVEKKVTQPEIQEELPKQIIQTTATINDPIMKELTACKTQNDVMRVARLHGLVYGRNSSKGFKYPEKCIIAVFNSGGTLLALLDKGTDFRTDFLTGKTIQNPEWYYNRQEGYNLLWLQNNNN